MCIRGCCNTRRDQTGFLVGNLLRKPSYGRCDNGESSRHCACRNAERTDACLACAAILIVYGGHRAAPSDFTDEAAAEAQRRQSRELAHRAGAIVPFDELPWRAAGAPPTTAPTVRGVIVPPPPNPASVEPAPAPAAASHSPLLQDPPPAVSYTHLTLPTTFRLDTAAGALSLKK